MSNGEPQVTSPREIRGGGVARRSGCWKRRKLRLSAVSRPAPKATWNTFNFGVYQDLYKVMLNNLFTDSSFSKIELIGIAISSKFLAQALGNFIKSAGYSIPCSATLHMPDCLGMKSIDALCDRIVLMYVDLRYCNWNLVP